MSAFLPRCAGRVAGAHAGGAGAAGARAPRVLLTAANDCVVAAQAGVTSSPAYSMNLPRAV